MLRDYQQQIIDGVRRSWLTGHKRPCIVAPCGSGKTIIAAELIKRATDKGNRTLFIVHRKELCEQTEETFYKYGVDMRLCTVGMVQTLTRRTKKMQAPKLIVVDENHHVYAESYTRILERFQDAYAVGLTATPVRLDGSGLGKINDDLIIGPTVSELIQSKHLAPFKYYSHVSADTSKLQVRRGEFVAGEINRMMGQDFVYGSAVNNYQRYHCQKSIVYCSSIANSQNTARAFSEAGISAAHVDGETPKPQRERIMRDFRDGKIKVLCNVDLVSEGFDVPDCDSCILLRPTMSLTLHIQQAMRPMRYMPGKTAIIIDQAENYKRHGLPDTAREWGLSFKKTKKKNEEKTRTCDCCYSVYDMRVTFCGLCEWDMRMGHCPECEKEQQYGNGRCVDCEAALVRGRVSEKKVVLDAAFEEIKSFAFMDYRECKSVKQLQQIQKARNYKPGWVYYKAKELNLYANAGRDAKG